MRVKINFEALGNIDCVRPDSKLLQSDSCSRC
jgi:hypothetical protein